MGIQGLKIIGETINDSIPKTGRLFEKGDLNGILELAKFQESMGADYLDLNIGQREPELMADLVKLLQKNISIPLSMDSPDIEIVRAGLEAYDLTKAKGKIPILNSISETRMEMFDLWAIRPFKVILIASERKEGSRAKKNEMGEDVLETAKAKSAPHHMINDDLIIDPGIAPIGADVDGTAKMALDAIRWICQDPNMKGIHFSVGLSNFSAMLPSKRSDGLPVRMAMENAFLTLALPLGLDYIIGNVTKDYKLLDEEDPAYIAVKEAMDLGGMESIMRIREFYQIDWNE